LPGFLSPKGSLDMKIADIRVEEYLSPPAYQLLGGYHFPFA
jgi:hypothetical protein